LLIKTVKGRLRSARIDLSRWLKAESPEWTKADPVVEGDGEDTDESQSNKEGTIYSKTTAPTRHCRLSSDEVI
jgi:hypothetical protein